MHDPRNELPLGRIPSRDEIEQHLDRARTLRAEAAAAFLGSAGCRFSAMPARAASG